jgi:hypothetical protein
VRFLFLTALIFLTGCWADWRTQAVNDAEELVRQNLKDPNLHFSRVQFVGDNQSGQSCGYFNRKTADGGETGTRFITFIDGGGGQNPFIDDPAALYPTNKEDFALNWRTQCLDLGYTES